MDWLPPGTANTPCQSIKSTKVGFRGHVEPLIVHIWHGQKSLKLFFDFFSVIPGIQIWVWPLNNYFLVRKITWNRETAISRLLCHLDLDMKILVQKFPKAEKFFIFDNKGQIFLPQKFTHIRVILHGKLFSFLPTISLSNCTFSFFLKIPPFWIGSTKKAQNGPKWPPKPPEMVLIC